MKTITKNNKMYRSILLILIAMVNFTSSKGQSAEISDQLKSNIESLLEANVVTGIIIGTTQAGEEAYYFKGVRSLTGKEPIDKNSIFEIGSISKTFTGLLLADMVVQGKIGLDDNIQKYLPEGIKAPTYDGQSIKLFQLSNHTSGLPRMPSNFNPADNLNPFKDYSENDMYEFLDSYELSRPIGSSYEYSNLAAGLLGHILSTASQMSYDSLLKTVITDPLGMDHTGISAIKGLLAKGHSGGNEVPSWDFGALQGAGAIRSTASDMMLYLKANMGLKDSKLYTAMQLAHKNSGNTESNPIVGLGWHTMIYGDKVIIWHNGATGGYTSFMGWIKGTVKGVVVLNNSTENVDDIGIHMLVPSHPLKVVRKSIDLDKGILESFVGDYELAPNFILTISIEANQLNAQATGQGAIAIYPESETEFFYKVIDAQLVFKKNENGKVESITLFQGGQEIVGKRMD